MKFSTAWHGFRYMSPANYFSAAAELGLSGVEVPLYHHTLSEWYGPVAPREVRRLAEECGVEMVAGVSAMELAGPFDELGRSLTERQVEVQRALALVLIDIAYDLGLGVLRIAEPNLAPEHQHLAEQYLADYGEALGPIGDYGETRGIRVAVENYGLSPSQIDSVLQTADHPNVGTLFDPCNYARMGEDPLGALRLLKDRVFYCHLKDTKQDEDRDPGQLFPGSRWRPSVAVGDGDIDWAPVLSELRESYDGYASIEYEPADDVIFGTRRSLDFIAATLEESDRTSVAMAE
ncbi:MAG: hypothetical protein BMS9Abin12_2149 [Acidimicrobiia bacterium]|nr:MAG: hypothetical protein BMS9Abin12_2149 [Acidimicrobiia bacterium]